MFEERYIAATKAKSLHEDSNSITQVDVIKASGMSERNIAAHYLRLISKPTRTDVERVHAALLCVATNHKLSTPHEAVAAAMAWLIDPRCKTCLGAGLVQKQGKEHTCPKCRGEKMRREPACKDVQLLIDYVQGCRAAYAGRMFALLR